MGYVGVFIYTAEIHTRCKLSHRATCWVRQLCCWSINLKQRNSRKYMGRWCDQNLISYSYHSVIICLLSVSMFVPAVAAWEEPSSRSHSSEFGQCAWVEVTVWVGDVESWRQRGRPAGAASYTCEQLRDTVGGNSSMKEDKCLSPSFSRRFLQLSVGEADCLTQ